MQIIANNSENIVSNSSRLSAPQLVVVPTVSPVAFEFPASTLSSKSDDCAIQKQGLDCSRLGLGPYTNYGPQKQLGRGCCPTCKTDE